MILQVKNVQNSIYFFGKYKTLKTLKVKSCMIDDLGSELQSRWTFILYNETSYYKEKSKDNMDMITHIWLLSCYQHSTIYEWASKESPSPFPCMGNEKNISLCAAWVGRNPAAFQIMGVCPNNKGKGRRGSHWECPGQLE